MRIKANRKFYISFQNIQLKNIRSTPLRSARQLTDPISLLKVSQWARWIFCPMHYMELTGKRNKLSIPRYLPLVIPYNIYSRWWEF